MSLKEQITAVAKPRIVEKDFEVNGETLKLRFRALKYPERKAIITSKFAEVGKDKDGKPIIQLSNSKVPDLNSEFLATTLVDEEDKEMFTKEEIGKNWDAITADKIANAGMEALGMTGETVKSDENPSTPNQESGTP